MDFDKFYNDLIGKKFENLTILSIERLEGRNGAYAKCQCVCGKTLLTKLYNVRKGIKTSCGCIKKERKASKLKTKCWHCKHAVPNHRGDGEYKQGVEKIGCEWSIFGKPVPGWKAVEDKPDEILAYCVIDCPKFEEG